MEAQEIANIGTRDVQKRINQGILEVSELLQAEAASEVNSAITMDPIVVPTKVQVPEHGIFDEEEAARMRDKDDILSIEKRVAQAAFADDEKRIANAAFADARRRAQANFAAQTAQVRARHRRVES